MATDNEFWNPKPEELFWECWCTSEDWQRDFNNPKAIYRQPRCTNCLQVAKFFRESKEKQAAIIKDLLGRVQMMSSWLAVNQKGPSAQIPWDVCEKIAGWDKVKVVTEVPKYH